MESIRSYFDIMCGSCVCFYSICFFKQMTAYEMRISDWSSDVCSSDLFTIQSEATLTTVLAGRVRMGTQPDIAALAVIIIGVTLLGAIAFEIAKRREAAREKAEREQARQADTDALRSEEHTSELQSLMRN